MPRKPGQIHTSALGVLKEEQRHYQRGSITEAGASIVPLLRANGWILSDWVPPAASRTFPTVPNRSKIDLQTILYRRDSTYGSLDRSIKLERSAREAFYPTSRVKLIGTMARVSERGAF